MEKLTCRKDLIADILRYHTLVIVDSLAVVLVFPPKHGGSWQREKEKKLISSCENDEWCKWKTAGNLLFLWGFRKFSRNISWCEKIFFVSFSIKIRMKSLSEEIYDVFDINLWVKPLNLIAETFKHNKLIFMAENWIFSIKSSF